jgi:hypothetical protein
MPFFSSCSLQEFPWSVQLTSQQTQVCYWKKQNLKAISPESFRKVYFICGFIIIIDDSL